MKLDEMKVQYDRARDGFTKESDFAVKTEKKLPKVDMSGIAIKIGLCAGVLALAFIVRAFGVGAPKETVTEVSTHADEGGDAEQNRPGKLKYVEVPGTKWTAPVLANDIEMMFEGNVLRFTAASKDVKSCMEGKVLSVGTDETFGAYVRVQSAADREAVYYGFDEIKVAEGDTVSAGDVIGTVTPGRSMYLRIFENGAPQDPSAYVDLSLNG